MFRNVAKLTTALGTAFVAVLALASLNPAAAGPPPGERWSDTAFGRSPRTQPSRVGPTRSAPRVTYTYPQVVRVTPVERGTVQDGVSSFVFVPGADGVVRTSPVAPGSTAIPVVGHPCR